MDQEFDRQWRQARKLENDGRSAEAKVIYETLLEVDPDRLYVRLRLSAIEEAQGHYRAAKAHVVRCAEAVRHQRWGDLAHVTRRLLAFDEPELVVDLITGVDWHSPEIIKESVTLSQHLWLTNHFEEALELIAIAEARARPSHLLAYSKAQALRYIGRMDMAAAEYERCLGIAPTFVYGHWSLSSHRKASPLGSRVSRIRKAEAVYSKDAPEQAYLQYALFKELDDAGDIEGAWTSLQAGAAIKRRLVPYNTQREEEGFRALEEAVTSDYVRIHESDRTAPVPIFIVGMPRTGTTLVERILGGHSQVAPCGELTEFQGALCHAADTFLGPFVTSEAVARLIHVDVPEVGRRYVSRVEKRASGKPFITDKNPGNFVNAGFIAKALPNARILCLRRHPMDACMSNLKELFGNDAYGYSYALDELADHYLRFDRLCRHWKAVLPDQFMEVQYEELVTDTERVVKQMLAFCGLPFDPDCLDITRNAAPVSTASSAQVRQPINTRGLGAWRRYATYLEPLRQRFQEGELML